MYELRVRKKELNCVNEDARACLFGLKNFEDNPEAADRKITWLPDKGGFEVPNMVYPDMYLGRALPGTASGRKIIHGNAHNDGNNPLGCQRRIDRLIFKAEETPLSPVGTLVLQPLALCPIFKAGEKLLLFFHNNSGKRLGFD